MPEEDDSDEADELEDFGGDDLEPPPLPQDLDRNGASPPPPELVEISARIAASTDALERQTLAHHALLASMADVLADPKISAETRRRELRTIAAAAAKLFPYARLYEAETLVKADRAELENRRATRAGAKMERRSSGGTGKVIPIRGSAVPKDPAGGIKP